MLYEGLLILFLYKGLLYWRLVLVVLKNIIELIICFLSVVKCILKFYDFDFELGWLFFFVSVFKMLYVVFFLEWLMNVFKLLLNK